MADAGVMLGQYDITYYASVVHPRARPRARPRGVRIYASPRPTPRASRVWYLLFISTMRLWYGRFAIYPGLGLGSRFPAHAPAGDLADVQTAEQSENQTPRRFIFVNTAESSWASGDPDGRGDGALPVR
eukprot:COSAG02_NODE_6514_length_3524_cov_7.432993_2_plen_129_part_00